MAALKVVGVATRVPMASELLLSTQLLERIITASPMMAAGFCV